MTKNALHKTESKIQQEIVKWYRNTHCLAHHSPRSMILSIPNEGRGANSAQLIQTGLYSGCADLLVIRQQWVGDDGMSRPVEEVLFFEVKTPAGIQSVKQKAFEKHCNQTGVGYYLVRSLNEFKAIIGAL